MMKSLMTIGLMIVTSLFMVPTGLAGERIQPPELSGHAEFTNRTDIGSCRIPGSIDYDRESQTYLVGGSGANIWSGSDHFSFAWRKLSGDFILTAEFRFIGEGVNPHRKAGWMIRKTLDRDSPYADAVVHGDGLTSLQYRTEAGGETRESASRIKAPKVLQLERTGKRFIMRVAGPGSPLEAAGEIELDLGDEVYAGLAICAHDDKAFEIAEARNLRIDFPLPGEGVSSGEGCASRLEILDVSTGSRKILYATDQLLEAPNWTPDGKDLVYNSRGQLFRFNLESREISRIDTGKARGINNDHVISWSGDRLGISHQADRGELSGSTISVLPLSGGLPVMVTSQAPSYLHGWSPDDRYLVYTARREGRYDIYRIPAAGGTETRLTCQESLDDGPEYSPDGEWIYFNSARTGTMQIWRMHPDGNGQEQLTFDQWNDWFPHLSPDGQTVLFLSYPPETDAQDHPRCRRVMLRTMSPKGGEARVVAYLYGGQGTINVPSWSPDGGRAAFVSYSYQPENLQPGSGTEPGISGQ